jgi:E3 ubiquitin-protein ligase DMA1/2
VPPDARNAPSYGSHLTCNQPGHSDCQNRPPRPNIATCCTVYLERTSVCLTESPCLPCLPGRLLEAQCLVSLHRRLPVLVASSDQCRPMLSPSVSVPTPEGANLHPTSSRRRALSYLRHLSHASQTRSGSGSPTGVESPRTSPRSYFNRSTSYPEPRQQSLPSQNRRRSTSRSNEQEATDRLVDGAVNRLNTNASELRVPSPTGGETTNTDNEAGGVSAEEPIADPDSDDMVRTRGSAAASSSATESTRPRVTRTVTSGSTVSNAEGGGSAESKPTANPAIRFFPHQEVRSNGRQSLNFVPVSRTLPNDESIIRVGRYSEREGVPNPNPNAPSEAPVGFKSKVVSRKHCEFSFSNGQWFIKDVASSSGTFLNHIRLSPPNTESKQFPVKDGDIIQLGIDFRGGEEMIFRCVKIRIECNRSWQKKPNTFK